MAKFEPTEKDKRFLEAFIQRSPGDTITSVQRKCRVGKNWFRGRRNVAGFIQWFMEEATRQDKLKLIELRDLCIERIQACEPKYQAEAQAFARAINDPKLRERFERWVHPFLRAKIDPQLVRLVKEWLDPVIQELRISATVRQEAPELTRGEMLQQLRLFLQKHAEGYCVTCGMPQIPLDLWKKGLEGSEAHLLEAPRDGEEAKVEVG